MLMFACALLPFSVSFANNYLDFGSGDFPYTSAGILIMLPLIAYVALSLKVYEFSPVAYQMLFDHVRDPIIVLDNDGRIICASSVPTGKRRKCSAGRNVNCSARSSGKTSRKHARYSNRPRTSI
jgi:hypothetical protein